jgi:hypothetical protein
MSDKNKTNFNHNDKMSGFYDQIQKTLVEQADYEGMGGHELQEHHGQGPHTQTSIGIGGRTVNFRKIK